jgi:hypothetical protein
MIPDRRGGEGQAIVTVDRALDAAGPGEGLVRPEKNGADGQKIFRNLNFP